MCKNGKYLEQNGGNYSLNSSGLHLIMPYMLIILVRSLPKLPGASLGRECRALLPPSQAGL